jgi:hypothetical protein
VDRRYESSASIRASCLIKLSSCCKGKVTCDLGLWWRVRACDENTWDVSPVGSFFRLFVSVDCSWVLFTRFRIYLVAACWSLLEYGRIGELFWWRVLIRD